MDFRAIVKLAPDEYVLWSTIMDAPASEVLTEAETVKVMASHGAVSKQVWKEIERLGTSAGMPVKEFLLYNRAGAREGKLSLGQIRKQYARQPCRDCGALALRYNEELLALEQHYTENDYCKVKSCAGCGSSSGKHWGNCPIVPWKSLTPTVNSAFDQGVLADLMKKPGNRIG